MVEAEFAAIKSPQERFRVKIRVQELLFEARYGTQHQNQVAATPPYNRVQYGSPSPPPPPPPTFVRSHHHASSPATSPSSFVRL